MIHVGWNKSPEIPSKWVTCLGLMQLTFWLLMTLSDELRDVNSELLVGSSSAQQQWLDASLGLLSSCSLLLVGHLIKTHSNLSWQGLLFTSLLSVGLFTYVLCADCLFADSISEKMVQHYQEVVLYNHQPIEHELLTLQTFPPLKLRGLTVLKMIGNY